MSGKSRYKKLPDLFVVGTECVFDDGTVMWLQVMNPFEVQEARSAAQTARARVVMAFNDMESDEWAQMKAQFYNKGVQGVIEDLMSAQYSEFYLKATQEIEVDKEWKERVEIMRSSEAPAMPLAPEEDALLTKISAEYLQEVSDRVQLMVRDMELDLRALSEDKLLEEYKRAWADRRAAQSALAEYSLSEMFWGTRVCEAVLNEDGLFTQDSHKNCNHAERIYDDRAELRSLPENMQTLIREHFSQLAMSVREAKNSDRQGSSSDSSPLPSVEAESTLSIPVETPASAHGI